MSEPNLSELHPVTTSSPDESRTRTIQLKTTAHFRYEALVGGEGDFWQLSLYPSTYLRISRRVVALNLKIAAQFSTKQAQSIAPIFSIRISKWSAVNYVATVSPTFSVYTGISARGWAQAQNERYAYFGFESRNWRRCMGLRICSSAVIILKSGWKTVRYFIGNGKGERNHNFQRSSLNLW